jgi:hypothetical protein
MMVIVPEEPAASESVVSAPSEDVEEIPPAE